MSDDTAEQRRGRRQSVSLNRLYPDPNNYRFVDHPEYAPVAPDHVFDSDVQRRTTAFVLGRQRSFWSSSRVSCGTSPWSSTFRSSFRPTARRPLTPSS